MELVAAIFVFVVKLVIILAVVVVVFGVSGLAKAVIHQKSIIGPVGEKRFLVIIIFCNA